MRKHIPGVPADVHAETKDLRLVRAAVLRAAQLGLIATIDGPVGTGKTYGALVAQDRLRASGAACFWVTMMDTPTKRELLARLHDVIFGFAPTRGTSEFELINVLVEHLTERARLGQCVVFVDEAHRLRVGGLQTLRHLHQRVRMENDAPLTMVCIGSDLQGPLLDALELDDRTQDGHTTEAWLRGTVVANVQQLHPLFAKTRPAVLLRLNDEYARGRVRPWAKILKAGLDQARKHGRDYLIDDDVQLVARMAHVHPKLGVSG